MTKQQFLSQLAGKLLTIEPAEREKILTYYAQMLDERIEDGMTEEDAVATMESVDVIAAEILEDHVPQAEHAEAVEVETVSVTPEQPKKKKNKGWAIALCIVIAVVATLLLPAVTGITRLITRDSLRVVEIVPGIVGVEDIVDISSNEANSESVAVTGDTMFDPAKVEFLKIYWEVGNVYVTVGDVEEITLHEEGTLDLVKHPMVLSTGNGGLTVSYAERTVFDRGISLIKNVDSKDLYVEVPASWMGAVTMDVEVGTVTMEGGVYESLNIDAALGEVFLQDVDAKYILIDADMGNVEADVRFDTLEAYLAAGDLELTAQQGSGRIEHADCDTGKISIEGDFTYVEADNDMGNVDVVVQGKPAVIGIDCDMGDIDLTLPETLGFMMEAETDMGSTDIHFPVEQQYYDDDRVFTVGDGACKIELSCDMGSIDVQQG